MVWAGEKVQRPTIGPEFSGGSPPEPPSQALSSTETREQKESETRAAVVGPGNRASGEVPAVRFDPVASNRFFSSDPRLSSLPLEEPNDVLSPLREPSLGSPMPRRECDRPFLCGPRHRPVKVPDPVHTAEACMPRPGDEPWAVDPPEEVAEIFGASSHKALDDCRSCLLYTSDAADE